MSSLAYCLSNLPLSPSSPGQPSLHLQQLQENPAAAQPPFHSHHKPSFLRDILLPQYSHTQRTLGQQPCKNPEESLLQLPRRSLEGLRVGGCWDGAC